MTPKPATEPAPAKINLYLHVTGKRADGYHLLDSLVVFAEIADRLSVAPGTGLSLRVTGPFAAGLAAEADNLVLRAARALAEAAGLAPNATLVLEKNLPVASGIGGGSADAAAALRLLRQFWGATPDPTEMHRIAARLGADVPVCLRGTPTRMRGVGEQLDPAPALPPCGLVLVNPGVALGTEEVFRAWTGGLSAAPTRPTASPTASPTAWPDAATMATDLHRLTNDLQPPAIALCPAIGEVLAAIAAQPRCLLARMSGSGATCFGLFGDADMAARAAAALARPGWWSWGGALHRA